MSTEYLSVATEAVREAGKYIIERYYSLEEIGFTRKALFDYVTEVDSNSEKLIINIIKEAFPSHGIYSEESQKENLKDSDYIWIIDPLDGTTNFIHRYPVFSVSIGLQHRGEVIAGVVYDPLREELFTAEIGQGSYLNGRRIAVSSRDKIEEAIIATGFPFRAKERIDDYLKAFRSLFLKCSDLRRAGSASLDLAYTATGRCDAFFEMGLIAWDVAAGSLLVSEAGGIVTDFNGGNDYIDSGNIVASANHYIHDIILDELKEFLTTPS